MSRAPAFTTPRSEDDATPVVDAARSAGSPTGRATITAPAGVQYEALQAAEETGTLSLTMACRLAQTAGLSLDAYRTSAEAAS